MTKNITTIGVHFYGTKKGKRKIEFQSERLEVLDGETLLTEAKDLLMYKNKAFDLLNTKAYKNITKPQLVVNFGQEDGEMIMIQLLPKQRIGIEL